MLLCSSKLPVNEFLTTEIFIELVIDWIKQSHNYRFDEIIWNGETEFVQQGKRGEILQIELFEEGSLCAVHFRATDNRRVEWTTDYILDLDNGILAFQLYRDVSSDTEYVHPAYDLPFLIQKVIDAGYFRSTNGINISDKPIFIYEDNVDLVKRLILDDISFELPVVYMSCITDGRCLVNPYTVAKKLKGVALVFVETSLDVSFLLREKTKANNPFSGAIEIYYSKNRRRFLPSELSGTHSNKIATVRDSVFNHLLQTKIEDRYSWSQLQSNKLRQQLTFAKSQAETDSKNYGELECMYEALLAEKEQQLETLTGQLNSANATKAQLEAQLAAIGDIPVLVMGDEADLYPNEQRAILLEILSKALSNVVHGSRRAHIIKSVLAANVCDVDLEQKRAKLKSCLHGYTRMTPATKRILEELGFKITTDSKHHKLIFCEDPRYSGTLSKTGSDHRGGDNTAHDLLRTIF